MNTITDQFSDPAYCIYLIFGAIVILLECLMGDSKGPTADISYTEFIQSLKSGEIKDIKNAIFGILFILFWGIYKSEEQTTEEAKNKMAYLFLITATTKSTHFKTTVCQTTSMIKEINEAAQSKNTKVETLPEKFHRCMDFVYYKS